MLTKNGLATFKAHVESELADVREAVNRIDKKFPEFSQKAPNDFVVAGFAGYLYHFITAWRKFSDSLQTILTSLSPEVRMEMSIICSDKCPLISKVFARPS